VIVCGIDPSLTSAGVAILVDGQPVHVSHHGYPGHNGASWQSRSRRVRWTVGKVMGEMPGVGRRGLPLPDLVVMEGPSYGSQHGSQFDRAGLWHGLFAALDAKGVPVAVVSPKTRAKWATGKGTDDKRTVFGAVVAEWIGIKFSPFDKGGNDEADAVTLAAMGALYLGDPLPIVLPQWRINGLTSVAWPEKVA
jgi:Holliday junction resolvasome RuvABC endonuclease subunit